MNALPLWAGGSGGLAKVQAPCLCGGFSGLAWAVDAPALAGRNIGHGASGIFTLPWSLGLDLLRPDGPSPSCRLCLDPLTGAEEWVQGA